MAKKKAELEADRQRYYEFMTLARVAERQGLYREAIGHAMQSWPFIDGMMQFEGKYEERDFHSVDAMDLVFRYAPLLMDIELLSKAADLLKQFKRIERDTDADMGAKLEQAIERAWHAHRLWSHIEQHGVARQDDFRHSLGGDQEECRAIAEGWERMGLVQRYQKDDSYVVALVTRMGKIVIGKCSQCGTRTEAPKSMFLEPLKCPSCEQTTNFVICSLGSTPLEENTTC